MKIYVNPNDFKCCASRPDETYMEIETDFFDGKCQTFIEGYRYVLSGATWTREDGVTFTGEMIAPWKDWLELDSAQREYEREQLVAYEQTLSEIEAALGVSG